MRSLRSFTLGYLIAFGITANAEVTPPWTKGELKRIRSLWLQDLPKPAEAANNSFIGNAAAEELGQKLFFDKRLSRFGDTACVTCHEPEKNFSRTAMFDVALHGPRRVPTLVGSAWSSFFFWDGRKDSLWSQTIGPLLTQGEHGLTAKTLKTALLLNYRENLRQVFGDNAVHSLEKDRSGRLAAVAAGKALSAYVATLKPSPSAFDRYIATVFSGSEKPDDFPACAEVGLRIFIHDGMCINCHNGPLLTNDSFHNTGVPSMNVTDKPIGRARGVVLMEQDPWRCSEDFLSIDPVKPRCKHVQYVSKKGLGLVGAFKVPTLRGVKQIGPYMHNGAFKSLREVVRHYRDAREGPTGMTELLPLSLIESDEAALVCFLETL